MKQLNEESFRPTPETCAALLVETVPLVMATLRAELRRCQPADLSVPQLRALACISRHAGLSMSAVTEHLGLSLSATSKLVQAMVERGYVTHTVCPADRRRAQLALTAAGQSRMEAARREIQARLTETLARLGPGERTTIAGALQHLRRFFAPNA